MSEAGRTLSQYAVMRDETVHLSVDCLLSDELLG